MGLASIVVRGIVFLVGIPFLLFGLFFLLLGGAALWSEYQTTQNVASTEGTITSSALEETTTVEDGVTKEVYYPRVSYTYAVDGRTYEGRRIFPSGERSSSSELEGKEYEDITDAQKVVRQYRRGESVTVYYQEGDPEEASLRRPSIDWAAYVFVFFFGGIPLAIGAVLSGGALFFGRIRARFGGSGSGDVEVDDEGWDDEDDDGWGDDGADGGGGWGGGGWGGDGGGGGGE